MKSTITATCILLSLLTAWCNMQGQPLFSYGSASVDKAEFLRAFLKNNNQQKPTEKDFRDYLQLYIRYKLKVKAAYDMRLDTLTGQVSELREFRKQLAEGFMYDEATLQMLVGEAFNRSQKDIHLAHLFIPLSASADAADTTKAYQLAMNAYHQLQKGAGFGDIAIRYSADTSARTNKGDVGYITVFTLPYPMENLAYATPPGTFSMPYRSRAGYHIFKNIGERKAVGRMKIAQILFAFPPDANSTVKAATQHMADSVYRALQNGTSFTSMVSKYSNDNLSSGAAGQMQEFGVGQFNAGFENAVFALAENGAISKPLLTSHGYHIVKRIERFPVNTDVHNEEAMAQLKKQVMGDVRMEVARQAMLQKMYAVTRCTKTVANEASLWKLADSTLHGKSLPALKAADNTAVFTFPKQQVLAAEWLSYLQAVKNNPAIRGKTNDELLKMYEDNRVRSYYVNHLEDFNPEFAAQLQEFKDGNLLFEVMQRNVWDKATADTAGLRKYFAANAQRYTWKPSADAILFSCKDAATAKAVKEALVKNGKNWRNAILPFENTVQADSGRFELGQIPARGNHTFTAGMITEPAVAADSGSNENTVVSFAAIIRVYHQSAPRNFQDARGFVLNDYQNYLEEQWLAALKKKYPVTINEKVLAGLW